DMEFDFDFDVVKEVSTTGAVVTTTSVSVSTVSPTRNTRVSTVDDITMAETLVYIRKSAAKDKGKGKMDESENVKTKTKFQQEQERLDFKAAVRLQAELNEEGRQRIAKRLQAEEREKYTKAEQARMLAELINQRKRYFAAQRAKERRNKPPTQAQQRTYMSNYIKHMGGYTLQQLRGYSFDEIKTLFETTMRSVNTFVPIESEVDKAVPELAAGSSKRAAEEELDQESSKRHKTDESLELAKEPRDKEADELSQEELQQMMKIVPEQGMNVETLQTKYPIIDWEIYIEGTRNLVKEKFNSTEPTYDKEREIWVELKRLFEPDTDDKLWKLQNHIHDLTWKLYDSCVVHHVSTEKGIDIYMLVEKEYPLSRETLTLMLVAKLLVDQDNEMSREILRKIFMQIERMIPGKGDLHDYWRGISTNGDFLGPPPSYTLIRDLMLRLCHRMMAYSIAERSQAPEKVTVIDLFAAGRKNKAHISGGQFVAHLAAHFGLLIAEILAGLTVIAPELPIIDIAVLVRLQIYEQLDDTWAWVAMGLERQPDAVAGALGVAQDALIVYEGG
ncbi:hypothetical protein Tco_1517412, partial [Tanacetum coccineum]